MVLQERGDKELWMQELGGDDGDVVLCESMWWGQ